MTDINYYLQQISTPFLDSFFLFVSDLTNEYIYIAIVAFIYYFISKNKGLKLGFVICSNMVMNVFLKNIFAVDRPYVSDGRIINKDAETGYGYSFPSGHSQFNSGFFSALHSCFGLKRLIPLTSVFVLLVAFSRVWLGVHTVMDVITGVTFGCLWGIGISRVLERIMSGRKYILLLFGLLGLADFIIFKGNDSLRLFLLYMGFASGYIFESTYVKYEMPEKRGERLKGFLLCVLGIIIIQLSFSPVGNFYLRSIKYALIGFWATGAAPLILSRKVKLWKK